MGWTGDVADALAGVLSNKFDRDGVVVAVAAIDESDTSVVLSPAGADPDSRFEIGSVTKTMTATLVALMAGRGRLAIGDQIGRWLAAGPHGGLTILQLATHTSGLPAVGSSRRVGRVDPVDPWAGYTFEQAEEDLRYAPVKPGGLHQYSNLGYQLLGLILERASGRDFSTLVREELLEPLGMTRSGVGSQGPGALLIGHGEGGEVAHWSQPWGAGGVEATVGDLARYARACLMPSDDELGRAISVAQKPVVRIGDNVEQALAWVVRAGEMVEHSGGTGGFTADVTVARGRGRAVALLVNYGGSPAYSTFLKEMARLAVEGDPRRVVSPQPWPTWRDDALETVRALLEGEIGRVHARLASAVRAKVTAEQLEANWTRKVEGAGEARDVAIAHHAVAASGAVMVDLDIAFASGVQRLRMVVLPTGELGGFTFPPATN